MIGLDCKKNQWQIIINPDNIHTAFVKILNNNSLSKFGKVNGNYYINCNLPDGEVGNLQIYLRNRKIIRILYQVINLNMKDSPNPWIAPQETGDSPTR